MTQGRKGRYRCAVHVCVFLRSVCLCIRVCVLCICSAFAFFSLPSLYCARVCCFVSFIHSLSPACFPTTCLPTLEIEKPHFFLPPGSGLMLALHFKAPDCGGTLHIRLAYLDLPTQTERLSLPLPLSLTLTQACGDVSSSNEETSHRRLGEQTGMLIVLRNRWKESNKK